MKYKNTLIVTAISLFAIALLVCLYLNALSHRYCVLSGSDQLVIDNWTRTKKFNLLPLTAKDFEPKEYVNLNILYQSLKANPSIKGLPDTFEEFKKKLLE